MSVFGTLGTKNVLILFFSALSVSLLVLLLLFSFFFKNLNFSVKTKDLENAPVLQDSPIDQGSTPAEEGASLNTNDSWNAKSLMNKLRINVPKEAERVQQIITDSPEAKTSADDYYIGVESDIKAVKKSLKPNAGEPSLDTDTDGEDLPPASPIPVAPQQTQSSAEASDALTTVTPSRYRVYLGGFINRADAEAARTRIAAQGYAPIVKASGSTYQVQAGVFSSKKQANGVASAIGASVEEY